MPGDSITTLHAKQHKKEVTFYLGQIMNVSQQMKIAVTILVILQISTAFCQRKPLEMAKQLLSVEGVKDTAGFYSDELDLRPTGLAAYMMADDEKFQNKRNFLPDFSELLSNHTFSFREFPMDSNYQIINVTARDSLNSGFDFYLHFKKKESNWQLADVCRLESDVVAELWMVNYTDHQVDSIINSSDTMKLIRSREQFDRIKALYNLTMGFDDSIISYFNSNRALFDKMIDTYAQFKEEIQRNYSVAHKSLAYINKDNLIITEINQPLDDLSAFYIVNTDYGVVGYFYVINEYPVRDLVKNKKLIFIREIGNGWFMFKGKSQIH